MRQLFTLLLILGPTIAFGQFGVNFHQTNLPFVGLNYEIINRLRPELRIGTDRYLDDMAAEGVLTYDILNKEDYEFYAGFGVRGDEFSGFVIPVGLNIYPLPFKNFGFHIEFAPIITEDEDSILRGSWGIRYRFRKSE